MKIAVYFKTYNLGYLFLKDNQIYYTSNINNEVEFQKNYASSSFYTLYSSNNKKIDVFPEFLSPVVEMCKSDFLQKQANITDNDSDFVKLYKLGKLNLDDFGFYIKSV